MELHRALHEGLEELGVPVSSVNKIRGRIKDLRNSLEESFSGACEYIASTNGGYMLTPMPDLRKAVRPERVLPWNTFLAAQAELCAGDLDFDSQTYALKYESKVMKLTFMEGEVFSVLRNNWGTYLTREQVQTQVRENAKGRLPSLGTILRTIKNLHIKTRELVGYDCIYSAASVAEAGRDFVAMSAVKPVIPSEIATRIERRRKRRSLGQAVISTKRVAEMPPKGRPRNPQSPARILVLS